MTTLFSLKVGGIVVLRTVCVFVCVASLALAKEVAGVMRSAIHKLRDGPANARATLLTSLWRMPHAT